MRIFLTIILLVTLAMPMASQKHSGQQKDNWQKELQDFKYKYLAQEMELREDQQKKFFELYGQMSAEKTRINSATRKICKELKTSGENASDDDYIKASDAISEAKITEGQIEKKYNEKFKEFLSGKQLYKMKIAEHKFQHKLIELQNKKSKKK